MLHLCIKIKKALIGLKLSDSFTSICVFLISLFHFWFKYYIFGEFLKNIYFQSVTNISNTNPLEGTTFHFKLSIGYSLLILVTETICHNFNFMCKVLNTKHFLNLSKPLHFFLKLLFNIYPSELFFKLFIFVFQCDTTSVHLSVCHV